MQGNEPVYDHPRMFTSPLPDTDSTVSSPTIIKSTSALSEFTFSDPKAQFQDKKHQSESFLPSKQTSIGSVHYDIKTDYNKLIKTTSVMIDLVGRILIRLETKLVPLKKRIEILEQFWNESAVLSEWIESAKVDIKEKKGITEDKKVSFITSDLDVVKHNYYYLIFSIASCRGYDLEETNGFLTERIS